jgi:hypothetical protein
MTSTPAMEPITRFKTYEHLLQGVLVLDTEQGVLTLLESCQIVETQRFSTLEVTALEELLGAYPHYCMHATFLHAMTGKSIEKCIDKVNWAYEQNTFDALMRPTRNILSRCRMKLRLFGLDIKSVNFSRYLLIERNAGMHKEER